MPRERLEVARYYLKLVELERFTHSNIHELSGGMKQRVALARALAPNPRVLLMDEPFGALDALTREQLYGDIQRIWEARRKTIIFVTHNVREAACLGDRVILFSPNPGRIRQEFPFRSDGPRHQQCGTCQILHRNHGRPTRASRRERRQPNEASSQFDGFFVLLILFWEAVARTGWYSPVLLPSPTQVGEYLWQSAQATAPCGPPPSSPCAGCLSAI